MKPRMTEEARVPEDSLEDRELVRRLLAKDERAQREFFNLYWKKVYKACVYILGGRDSEAEDLAQEALLVALRKMPEFEFRSSLHHWLFRICTYLCFERIRKRKRDILRLEEDLESLRPQLLAQHRRNQDDEERNRLLSVIARERDNLGEPCRGLLELRDGRGQSYAAIAKTLRIPIGTVMSRLSRCKEALKKLVLGALGEAEHV